MKLTNGQKQAIKKICNDFDFENYKELKAYLKDMWGDILDYYWFSSETFENSYRELEQLLMRMK
jgi:hypothetical protein